MTKTQIQAQLRQLGLPVTGTKDELADRLEAGQRTQLAAVEIDTPADTLAVSPAVQDKARTKALAIIDEARALKVTTDAEYQAAGDFLGEVVKAALGQLDDAFDPIISSWHAGHKQSLATKRELAAPLKEAEAIAKGAMAKYHLAVQAAQREAAAKLAQEAAEQAAIERATALLDEGKDDEAEGLLTALAMGEVEPTFEAPVKVVAPKAEGTSVRMLKRYRVTDESKVRRAYLTPDHKAIQALVNQAGKGAEEIVGGIEFFEEPSVGVSRRR
jgi:hypothetical protein